MKAILIKLLSYLTRPTQDKLVRKIVSCTAGLQLTKEETVSLPALQGSSMYGKVYLSGNSLPGFRYTIWTEDYGFIHINCYLSCTSTNTNIKFESDYEMKPEYQKPIIDLLYRLYEYFPLLPKEIS